MPTNLRQRLTTILIPLAAIAMVAAWLYIAPPGILGKLDALGYAVCHRIDERSFHIDGRALPVCARCSGMYIGAVLGLLFQALIAPKRGGMPGWKVIIPLGVLFAAFAIDGSNSYLYLLKSLSNGPFAGIPNLYTPNNTLRLFTGLGTGLGIAAALYPSFNQTVFKDWDARPALDGTKSLGLLLVLAIVTGLLMLPEWPVILYPMAFISAGGILLVLSMVYSMIWLMLMREENVFERLRDVGFPMLAGLTVALIQITAIDLFRLWLTGTWGGFPLR
jgi:uncharacterized membrane protein